MTRHQRSSLAGYGSAIGSVALASLMCLVLDPILHLHLHYLWMILALLFTGYFFGARPCLLAFSLSLLVVAYYFLPPRFCFAIEEPINEIGLLLYSVVGLAVVVLSSAAVRGVKRIAEADTLLLNEMPAKMAAIEKQLERHLAEGRRMERLLAIQYKVTAILAKAANLREAVPSVLQTIGESLDWQVGLFWSVDRQAQVLRCVEAWQGLGAEAAPFVQFSRCNTYVKGVGLAGRVWLSEHLVCVPDMSKDALLPRAALAARAGLRGTIAFPVNNGFEFLGVMEFFGSAVTHPEDDVVQMMTALGGQICQFIERRNAEKSLREQEHERRTAHAIQQGLLPKQAPSLAGFRIGGKSLPAQDVGGDCFDFIPLDGDGLAIVLADASGHGIGPALIVAETRAYLHALTMTCPDMGQILTLTNARLANEVLEGRFVTLFLGRFDAASRSLVYGSAGHCPGYHLDGGGEIKTVLAPRGMPLGIDRGNSYSASAPISLRPNDLLLLYSDGIPEAHSPNGTLFGVERMLDLVRLHRRDTPENILDALFQALVAFCHGCPPQDDMTAVLLQVEPESRIGNDTA